MMNLGHSHPDFTYANDLLQAKFTLVLAVPVSIIICWMIVVSVFRM